MIDTSHITGPRPRRRPRQPHGRRRQGPADPPRHAARDARAAAPGAAGRRADDQRQPQPRRLRVDGRAGLARRAARLRRARSPAFSPGSSTARRPTSSTVPCDSPLFPDDLVARLAAALEADDAEIAMAATREDGELRLQPVFCLMRATVLESLVRFTPAAGARSTPGPRRCAASTVAFDDAQAFANANTLDELRAAAAAMTRTLPPRCRRSRRASPATTRRRCRSRRRRSSSPGSCRACRRSRRLALRSALGRVLARDIVSAIDVPAHDNSAMDGYALRGSELAAAARQRVHGRRQPASPASRFDGARRARGECVRIMTGAVMPAGLDTVVPQEFVRVDGDRVHVPAGVVAARRQPAPRRRRPGARRSRARRRPHRCARPTSACSRRSARPRCAVLPAPARRLLLHRRRAALDRRAARRRLRLRQQPLHAVGHAAAPRRRGARPRRRARRPGRARGRVPRRRATTPTR